MTSSNLIPRHTNQLEKENLYERIVSLRKTGHSFHEISKAVNLSERNVMKHWKRYLDKFGEQYKKEKAMNAITFLDMYRQNYEFSSKMLAKAQLDENEDGKEGRILFWQREKRESLEALTKFMERIKGFEQEATPLASNEPMELLIMAHREKLKELTNGIKTSPSIAPTD